MLEHRVFATLNFSRVITHKSPLLAALQKSGIRIGLSALKRHIFKNSIYSFSTQRNTFHGGKS
jgi:hypothetical protein